MLKADAEKQTIIITGGAGDLGTAIASHLKSINFHPVIFDRDETRLATLENDYECLQVDLLDEEGVIKAIDDVTEKHGTIHGLINNAGVIYSELLFNLGRRDAPRHSLDQFKKTIDANLTTAFLTGAIVAEKMIMTRTKGVIINISSISATGNAGQTAYAAAKAGLNAMTITWSKELGAFGIRCAAIAPGFIETESTAKALTEDTITALKSRIPLKQLGRAEHIAQTAAFILQNDYINGKIIEVDGGLTL